MKIEMIIFMAIVVLFAGSANAEDGLASETSGRCHTTIFGTGNSAPLIRERKCESEVKEDEFEGCDCYIRHDIRWA